ncbi:lia operon protein LiaI [Bacillus mesophilus]|uniref:Flagellar basal body rod protein n=1 Tax=Bacillus mesophilus TaxID=1808955 RepID=A0A6M0QD51_9BACI|nr:flagellar basal body rod protein [Bacillus mesophilus]MBM7662987.1 lia operon protein LiaI [Bacillus mesophilus]NEY73689.1 flagellar basal body rod protein [Bacillus mesophilus]
MKKFLLFTAGVIALVIVIANLGPMVLLGVSVWLLYLLVKQFLKTESTIKKIGWVMIGLILLSIAISNIYAVIGIAAAYVLYLIYKEWKVKKHEQIGKSIKDDPFTNFEKQWAELTK